MRMKHTVSRDNVPKRGIERDGGEREVQRGLIDINDVLEGWQGRYIQEAFRHHGLGWKTSRASDKIEAPDQSRSQ